MDRNADLHHGNAYQTAQLFPGGGRLDGVDSELAWQIDRRSQLGLAMSHWRDLQGNQTRAQLWWRFGLR